MDSTAISLPQILLRNQKYGPRTIVDGNDLYLLQPKNCLVYKKSSIMVKQNIKVSYLMLKVSFIWLCGSLSTCWGPSICCCTLFWIWRYFSELLYGESVMRSTFFCLVYYIILSNMIKSVNALFCKLCWHLLVVFWWNQLWKNSWRASGSNKLWLWCPNRWIW